MCDTLYAGPAVSGEGRSWFAKNSDRHPAEPQALCLVPRREPSPDTKVGARSFAIADRGHAFLLSKPSWMAGGEMGVNDRGVAIGNEAVFSRFKAAKDGILGMDILRAALAHADSAEEARAFICDLVEKADQGGNGAFKGSLVYSNSFIVADAGQAFVLETAGRRWAWRPARDVDSISNAYTIEDDYKRLDAQTRKEISPVNERLACVDETDAARHGEKESWKRHVEDRFYLRFSKGEERRACTLAALGAAGREVGFAALAGALRSHGEPAPGASPAASAPKGMALPCLHEAGFPVRSSTTASLILEYLPPGGASTAIAWFTGTSYPCLSVYAPVLLAGGGFVPLWTDYDHGEGSAGAYDFWERRRALFRQAGGRACLADPAFTAMRDGIQDRLRALAAEAAREPASADAVRREVGAAMRAWDGYLEG